MHLPFVKYQGAGNDFIVLNGFDLSESFVISEKQIIDLCDRRFGVGADGVLLLKKHPNYDFRMLYYNADGSRGSFCGNGGRCITAYANKLGLFKDKASFLADDGVHFATITAENQVNLKMTDVESIQNVLKGYFLNTGTQHYVEFVGDISQIDVATVGKKIRQHSVFKPEGTNVNFISIDNDEISIRTYEKGVEAETLACGTGAIAAAIVHTKNQKRMGTSSIIIQARGGQLTVRLHYDGKTFSDIWLSGRADFVFEGKVILV